MGTLEFAKIDNSATLKSDFDKSFVDKLETFPTDLSKPSDVIDNNVTKKTVYD